MTKVKFFREDSVPDLEFKVNSFINNKIINHLSYSVAQCGYGYIHCCCVAYQEI